MFDEFPKNRRLIPGPSSNFENYIVIIGRCEFRHQCDDIRLRNRLAVPDGQRAILVGERHLRRRHEGMALHRLHRGKYRLTEFDVARHPRVKLNFRDHRGTGGGIVRVIGMNGE